MAIRPSDDRNRTDQTAEVGSEGGTPGDVEVAHSPVPATGSEAGETWRPADDATEEIRRDETGEGRRTP